MIEFADRLLSAVKVLSDLRPGLSRHCREHVVLSRALLTYRTPSNHHLRRALRLSWVRAATTLVDHCLNWAKKNPLAEGAESVCEFQAAFDAAREEVIETACNQDSGEDIGTSPIDAALALILEDLPGHLSGRNVGSAVADSLAATLAELTGWGNRELPVLLLRAGREGIAPNGGERRHFGQLLFDEFARVVQDPNYYPEAGASFSLVQQRATQDLMKGLEAEVVQIAEKLPAEVAAEVRMALGSLPEDWLAGAMAAHTGVLLKEIRKLNAIAEDIPNKVIDALNDRPEASEPAVFDPNQDSGSNEDSDPANAHRPVQDRTVCFAGFRDLSGVESVFDQVCDQLSRKANLLSDAETIVPMTWDFALSAEGESDRGRYVQTEAWATLDEQIIGAVLVLDAGLGRAIDADEAFLDALEARGWFEDPVVDVLDKRPVERRALYRNGAIPITYETRFALECLIRGRSLLVVAPEGGSADSPPLSNLLRLLENQGVACISYAEAEHATDWAADFLARLPGVTLGGLPNPYRGLDYYQISDGAVIVGREPESAQAIALLSEALEEKHGLLLGITGPSGCGKSSFLRARVAAGAMDQLSLQVLELRPTDFRVPQEAKIQCLPHLCAEIAALLGVEPPEALVGAHGIYHKAHLPLFKKWLARVIAGGKPRPVLICLDQFEEILDDLSEGLHEGEWRALADILTHLSETHGWPVVFTLEDSRKARFERLKDDLAFGGARLIALSDRDPAFYRKIITRPFQEVGIDLDGAIVEELLAEVAAQRDEGETSASPLPLLALRLYELFRQLSPRAPKSAQPSPLGREFARLAVTRDDLRGASLALGEMVADLAETAWVYGGGKDDIQDLGAFLRPLVRISLDPERPEEAKLVLQSVRGRGYRNEQALQAEFLRRRVLVPAGGGLRLVHEAVIRRWPRAKTWFKKDRTELEKEAMFRADALRWIGDGEPPLADNHRDEEHIGQAARILIANLRDWSPSERPHLDPETEALRRYAIGVFKASRTPGAPVKPERPDHAHVHVAACYGLNDLLKTFCEIDPDCVHLASGKRNRTPLSQAAWNHLATVKLLLEAGADVEIPEQNGFCPLDSAVWAGQADIVEVLVREVNPANWGKDRKNPLNGAAARARSDIAEMLTARGFRHDQPTLENWTPLHQAATSDDLGNFKYFLKRGDITARWQRPNRTPPASKTVHKNQDGKATTRRPELLLDRTPLHVAAQDGCQEIVRHLLSLEQGFALLEDPGETGETPLMLAARAHRYLMVEQLLAVMDNPNGTAKRPVFKGYNALHFALLHYASNQNTASGYLKRLTRRTVRMLLQSPDLDVMAKTASGKTAWQMAAGLPEVQGEIAAHPRFPLEAIEQFREEERKRLLADLKGSLFEAALKGDKTKFTETLAAIEPGEPLHIKKKALRSTKFLDRLMLGKGWTEALTALIASGRIDPWRREENYSGLYGFALQTGAAPLIAAIEQTMPATIPGAIARAILHDLRQYGSKIADPDGAIHDRVFSRVSPDDLDDLLFCSARLGDGEVYEELLAKGADPDKTDDWGRTAMAVAPDALREARGLPAPMGLDAGPRGNSLFYPDDEAWRPVKDLELAEILHPSGELAWDDRVVLSERALSFYPDPGVRLIRAKHPEWAPESRHLYWLEKDGDRFRLDGRSLPIHAFTAKVTLDLSESRAVDYLKFFCFFVRGDEGPYYVIDGRDAAYLPESCKAESDPGSDYPTAFRRVYRGPRQFGLTAKGQHRISAMICHGDGLFIADFAVSPRGMIDMLDDWPIIAGLPDKVDAPL